jgi:hypothetical protein
VITGNVYWDRLFLVYSNATLFPKNYDHLYYDVEQSSLGDCYFLSSISVINESILQDLFVTKTINEQGLYLVNFYIRGRKWIMSVDDEFLFEKKYDNLRFSKYRPESNTLWVPIIEKAFAKLRGNYDNVIAGNPANALRMLTGVPVYDFPTANTTLESTWFHLQHGTKMSFPMTALTHVADWKRDIHCGVTENHAYSILTSFELSLNDGQKFRLLMMRNPRSEVNYYGRFNAYDQFDWDEYTLAQVPFGIDPRKSE